MPDSALRALVVDDEQLAREELCFLLEQAGFTAQEDEELRAGVKSELNEALRRAEASPLPDAASVADGVYAQ